jgi:hypothetical protein
MRRQWFVGLLPMGGLALRLRLPVVLRIQQLREAPRLAVLLVRELRALVVEQPLEAALGMVMMITTFS